MSLFNDVSEEAILSEIERIISEGAVPAARAAREYYGSGDLPGLTERYFRQRGVIKRNRQAEFLGVSSQTLNRIFSGADISENMLFRFRTAIHRASLNKYYRENEVEEILGKPWRVKDGGKVNEAIRDLVEIIEFLLNKLYSSNSIGSGTDCISDLHKAQIIAILRELLAKLEAPVVNIQDAETALSRAGHAVKKGFSGAVENETRNAVESFLSDGRKVITEFIKQRGFSSFGDFF